MYAFGQGLVNGDQGAYRQVGRMAFDAALSGGVGLVSGGKNIVGTAYDAIKPTQDWIYLSKVGEYKSILRSGKTLSPIITYKNASGIFIENGHHRFVAYMELGMKPNMVLKNTGGPVGLPNWLNTTFEVPPLEYYLWD